MSAPTTTARAVALSAISKVITEGAYSTIAIPSALASSKLDERDRRFTSELAFGVLRTKLRLDAAIAEASSRPIERIDQRVLDIIRLGAYQLLFMAVASHAAVSETVSLASDRERGFVNAVLRRISKIDTPPSPAGASAKQASIRTGMAPWMLSELEELLGSKKEAEEAAEALAHKAPLSMRVNLSVATVDEVISQLASAQIEARPSSLEPTCLIVDGGDPSRFPGFAEGWFTIQDEASATVVRALEPQVGDRVLDACAAPGGKAAFIASETGPDGFVVASELHPWRCASIEKSARRLKLNNIGVVAQDATASALTGPFDRILVDAPCSGMGSARRRPELLWRPKKERLTGLAALQVEIVRSCAPSLSPGGLLVYSVCTFTRIETDAVVEEVLRAAPELIPAQIPSPTGPAERYRLWPHRDGSDGMFVAGFRKRD